MALTARYRPGATARPFVDREPVLATFDGWLRRREQPGVVEQPEVLVLTGIGGIGKSRLLGELRRRLPTEYLSAVLDLQVPAQRDAEAALAVLRAEYGRQKVKFHRFDIAYAVLWQRLHPHLSLSAEGLPLVAYSEILTEIVDAAAGLPVFGTATKLLDATAHRLRRWQTVRGDPVLGELDRLPLPELVDAVSYLFAAELTGAGRPYALFVDAYDALVGGVERAGAAAAGDAWLRDVLAQLDTGVVVVASREPLGWGRHHPDWGQRLRTVDVTDLPLTACEELLASSGVTDPAERLAIAESSAGVPFYLHLALDSYAALPAGDARVTVAPEAVLERFLRHVEPGQVRALELLSVAREIDEEIFAAVTGAFGVPDGPLAWRSLVGYSFVYDAFAGDASGGDAAVEEPQESTGAALPPRYRLHQLMVGALQRRLRPDDRLTLHQLLHRLWSRRADTGAGRAVALREAVYHGTRGGSVDATAFLGYLDRIAATGGNRGLAGLRADLLEHLADRERPDPELAGVAVLLAAEAALLLGDAAGALDAARRDPPPGPGPVAERLAVATANAQRILGATDEALRGFRQVWERGGTPARLVAGLWVADLAMCQGRFAEALEITGRVAGMAAAGDAELRGDLARLRSLAFRFGGDLEGSAAELERAAEHYRAARSVIGSANVATNRAELLALTDPAAAVAAAGAAIETQRELGAQHEQGKAYTALGVARMLAGDHDAAEHALAAALEVLERAGYRSGRARALLYRAALRLRQGRRDDAVTDARQAAAELVVAAVYPTLVLVAAALFRLHGAADPVLEAAARAVRRLPQPLPGGAAPEEVAGRLAGRLVGLDVDAVYAEARRRDDAAAGFYNHNVRVVTVAGAVNVRIPVDGADQMDLRIWPEAAVLRAVTGHVAHVPRLRFAGTSPPVLIQDHLDAPALDALAPRGVAVAGHVPLDVAAFFGDLGAVGRDELPPPPPGWPDDGDVAAFARQLSAVTSAVHARHAPDFGAMFAALGIPDDPIAAAVAAWPSLTSRPFRLVHADVHRKNMIVDAGVVWFLDFELALWGDPLYDVASHLHKMTYLPGEEEAFLAAWRRAEPAVAATPWRAELETYLRHERVKSAVVDSVRYAKLLNGGACSPERERELLGKLGAKLRAAYPVWGLPVREFDQAELRAAVRRAGSG